MIRTSVLIVDDHQSFTDLLAAALSSEPDFRIVGSASNGAAALDAVRTKHPDLVLVDIQLGDENGLDVIRQIRDADPSVTTVVVSAHHDPSWVSRAAGAGASAYAPKSGSLIEMLAILRSARRGEPLVAVTNIDFVADSPEPERAGSPTLTTRERQVLRLMGQGRAPAQIAKDLGISTHTARGYVKAIHMKLDAHSQLQAVVTALRLGILEQAE